MMQQEEIEIKLWGYIDGTCDQQDHEYIIHMIDTDKQWKTTYQSLLAFNSNLSEHLLFEKTPTNVTKKVMEEIAIKNKPSNLINMYDWGTKGIAAFFIISIGTVLILSLSELDWNWKTKNTFHFQKIALPEIDYSPSVLYSILFVVLFLGLMITDKLISNRKIST